MAVRCGLLSTAAIGAMVLRATGGSARVRFDAGSDLAHRDEPELIATAGRMVVADLWIGRTGPVELWRDGSRPPYGGDDAVDLARVLEAPRPAVGAEPEHLDAA